MGIDRRSVNEGKESGIGPRRPAKHHSFLHQATAPAKPQIATGKRCQCTDKSGTPRTAWALKDGTHCYFHANPACPTWKTFELRFIYVCWRGCNLRVLELQKAPLQKTLLPLCMGRSLWAERTPPDELLALQAFREALKVFVLQWMLLERVVEIIREEHFFRDVSALRRHGGDSEKGS